MLNMLGKKDAYFSLFGLKFLLMARWPFDQI
jgi:hypothetical protein